MSINYLFTLSFTFIFISFLSNAFGEDSKHNFKSAIPIPMFENFGEKFVELSYAHGRFNKVFFALTEEGQVYTWGTSLYGFVLGDKNSREKPTVINFFKKNNIFVEKIVIGINVFFALDDKGDVYVWGKNDAGHLGLGKDINEDEFEPCIIPYFKENSIFINDIVSGKYNNRYPDVINLEQTPLALDKNGKVYSWGVSRYGIGLGDNEKILNPTLLSELKDKVVIQISKGKLHNLVLTEDGKIYSWGRNYNGQLGLGHTENVNLPREVDFFRDKVIIQIAADEDFSLALTKEGLIYSWGSNKKGELGLGDTEDYHDPKLIVTLINIEKVLVSDTSCFALDKNGLVYAWGQNNKGQLGTGDKENILIPRVINIMHLSKILIVQKPFENFSYSLALTENGLIYVWGDNKAGQLGLGHTSEVLTPQHLSREHFWGEDVVNLISTFNYSPFKFRSNFHCFSSHCDKVFDKQLSGVYEEEKGDFYSETFILTASGKIFVWGSYYIEDSSITEDDLKKKFSQDEIYDQYAGMKKNIYALKTAEGQDKFYDKLKTQLKHEIKPKVLERLKSEDIKKKFQTETLEKSRKSQGGSEEKFKGEL